MKMMSAINNLVSVLALVGGDTFEDGRGKRKHISLDLKECKYCGSPVTRDENKKIVCSDNCRRRLNQKELEEELCKYCELPAESQGVHCYGGQVQMCQDSGCCEKAYQEYLYRMDSEEI